MTAQTPPDLVRKVYEIVAAENPKTGVAYEAIAARAGASRNVVERVVRLHEEARVDLLERIVSGELSMNAAEAILRAEVTSPRRARLRKAEKIKALAKRGHDPEQIGRELGVSAASVRDIAREFGLVMTDQKIGRRYLIDRRRVVDNTVHGLAGYAASVRGLDGEFGLFTKEEARERLDSINESMATIAAMVEYLKREAKRCRR